MLAFGNFLADHLLILILWMLAVNLLLYALCGEDENRAAHKKPRYSMLLLLPLALAGGAFGGMIGAIRFTKKKRLKRRIALWLLIALIQESVLVYALFRAERTFSGMLSGAWADLAAAFHRLGDVPGWGRTAILVIMGLFCLISLAAFGLDKRLAVSKRRRIPESALIFLTVAGGAVGSALGMLLFRHKTRHAKFTVAVTVFLVLQLFLLLGILLG